MLAFLASMGDQMVESNSPAKPGEATASTSVPTPAHLTLGEVRDFDYSYLILLTSYTVCCSTLKLICTFYSQFVNLIIISLPRPSSGRR